MPYWLGEKEESVTVKLAAGIRWKLSTDEKLALVAAWKAENRAEYFNATHELVKLRLEYQSNGDKYADAKAHATVAAYMSSRWDIWQQCMDRAMRPPMLGSPAMLDAHSLVNHVLAIASRRNAHLQTYAEELHAEYEQLDNHHEYIEPTYTVLTKPNDVASALDAAIRTMDSEREHSTRDKRQAEHSYLLRLKNIAHALQRLVSEHTDTWDTALKRTKARLDTEIRRVDGLAHKMYWLPTTPIAILKHTKGFQDRR